MTLTEDETRTLKAFARGDRRVKSGLLESGGRHIWYAGGPYQIVFLEKGSDVSQSLAALPVEDSFVRAAYEGTWDDPQSDFPRADKTVLGSQILHLLGQVAKSSGDVGEKTVRGIILYTPTKFGAVYFSTPRGEPCTKRFHGFVAQCLLNSDVPIFLGGTK